MNIKKIINLTFLLASSGINSMQFSKGFERQNILDLPSEVLEQIICPNLYDNIKSMDLDNIQNIFDFYSRLNLTQEDFNILLNFRATCKHFNKFYPDYVKKIKEKFEQLKEDVIKDYRDFSKSELCQKLEDTLNTYNSSLEECCRLVLTGANANIQSRFGYTPLILAAIKGNVGLTKFLLGKPNIDVDIQAQGGYTALIFAAYYGHIGVVKLLLEHNANFDIRNHNGETALDLAETNNHKTMINLIKKYKQNN